MPVEVRRFLLKGLVVFIAWKLLFHLWLQPVQWPDAPLVKAIASQVSSGLNILKGDDIYGYKIKQVNHSLRESKNSQQYLATNALVTKQHKPVLLIVPNCNGLELMVLFAGFIICFPGKWQRKSWFIPAGILAIHVVNVLRSMALVGMSTGWWKQYFNFAHHYLFSLTIYLFIFMLWAWYVKSEQRNQPGNP